MRRKAINLFLFIGICRFNLSVFSGMVKIRYKSLGEVQFSQRKEIPMSNCLSRPLVLNTGIGAKTLSVCHF